MLKKIQQIYWRIINNSNKKITFYLFVRLGIEVSPLNPFIKDYYSNLKGDELNEAEVNVLGNKQNLEKLVLSCEEKLNDKSIIESERELLQNTIEDTKYQINTQNEIINLIQSLKVKERNKNAK